MPRSVTPIRSGKEGSSWGTHCARSGRAGSTYAEIGDDSQSVDVPGMEEVVAPSCRERKTPGRADHRSVFYGILRIMRTGARWGNLLPNSGKLEPGAQAVPALGDFRRRGALLRAHAAAPDWGSPADD
jgi:hypothetical protein